MKNKWVKRLSGCLAAVMAASLCACGINVSDSTKEGTTPTSTAESVQVEGSDEGISEGSPYYGKGFDLAERKNVVLYVLGDEPADMDRVLDEANNK